MTNKLVVIINSLKVPKIKKILLYEIKFLVPNYSCLQNPGGYRPHIPVLSVLCPQLNLLKPPHEQNSWVRHCLSSTPYNFNNWQRRLIKCLSWLQVRRQFELDYFSAIKIECLIPVSLYIIWMAHTSCTVIYIFHIDPHSFCWHLYQEGRVPSRSDVFIDVFTAAVWIGALHSHNYPHQVRKRIRTYITSLYAEEGQNKRK